jgi:hypothetical protein
LGSDQVHNRLSAMLTFNIIINVVSGLAVTSQTKTPSPLIAALIGNELLADRASIPLSRPSLA